MKISYNLISESWIPVLSNVSHRVQDVSLRDAIVNAHEYREIAHDSPLVIASLHCLLLAVCYSIWQDNQWDTEEREDDWRRLWNQGHFDAQAVDDYFAKWHDRFDLFHPDYPFYQVKGLEMNELSSLVRLAMEENNAPRMFTNRASPDWDAPSPALAALLLVAIQSFALGFGKSSKARIEGVEIEPPYSADGPLLRGLTVWPSGENLFQTLMFGLVPTEHKDGDKPCWEHEAPHTLRDTLVGGRRKTVSPLGICDLLTFQSRLIRLVPEEKDGQLVIKGAYFTQGRSLEKDDAGRPEFHPLKIYKTDTKLGILPITLSENKAIWRNAHALLQEENRETHPSLCFVAELYGDGMLDGLKHNLQVVGMATEPGKAGKFLLWRHERMPIAPRLLKEGSLVAHIESANSDADLIASEMRRQFAIVARTFLAGGCDGNNKPDPDDVKALVEQFDPRRAFWPRLEDHFYQLLEGLASPETVDQAISAWQLALRQTGIDCLYAACNGLGLSTKSIRARVAVAQIDFHWDQKFNLEYLRDPNGYIKEQKALKSAQKANASANETSSNSPSPSLAFDF